MDDWLNLKRNADAGIPKSVGLVKPQVLQELSSDVLLQQAQSPDHLILGGTHVLLCSRRPLGKRRTRSGHSLSTPVHSDQLLGRRLPSIRNCPSKMVHHSFRHGLMC